jgi:hypothetical protein
MLPVIGKLVSMLPSAKNLISAKTSAIAVRLGMSTSKITASSLASLARQNKVTAALIAYEVYGIGSDIVNEIAASDPELASIIENLSLKEDVIDDTTSASDIIKFAEEFEVIQKAADNVGGMDALINLRTALSMSTETLALFLQVKELGKVLR